MNTCKWPLGNGETLEFTIYDPKSATWNKTAGLYIFASPEGNNYWHALYVGQTEDFSSRIPNHEHWATASLYGATTIHALSVPLASNREYYERLLIQHLQPPLNVQGR